KGNVRSGDSPEMGEEPSTSRDGGEAAGGVACPSEESTHVPLRRAVRPAVPSGCVGLRLRALPGQRRRTGGRRPDVRGHRGVWSAEVAGSTDGGTPAEGESNANGPAGRDTPTRPHDRGGWHTRRVMRQ